MNIKNVECKARVQNLEKYEKMLLTLQPALKGTDHQIDTYFNTVMGRLKLREGTIENALIHYERDNIAGAKESNIVLYQHTPNPALKEILTRQLGVKVIVDKIRKIYFVNHVKFHLDEVKNLGTFVEIEVIDDKEAFTIAELRKQCDEYIEFLGLQPADMIDQSYSDLLLNAAH